MTTVADYVGRTVDLLLYQGADYSRSGDKRVTQALVQSGNGGYVTTGIQKLAQRYLLELLTSTGTMQYLPARGSQLMLDARRGGWRTSADVQQSFVLARSSVRKNLLIDELATDPDDERYADSELTGVTVSPDLVVLHINIVSQAGTSREVIAPITVSTERTV